MPTYTLIKYGKITGTCKSSVPPTLEEGMTFIEDEFPPEKFYLENNEIHERMENPSVISAESVFSGDAVYLLDVPETCSVASAGLETTRLEDGRILIDTAGEQRTVLLMITSDTHLDARFVLQIKSMDALKKTKGVEIDAACKSAILSGFNSDALGTNP